MEAEPLYWHNETRRVADLVEYRHNPRKMTAQQMRKLRESLEKFGLVEVPAINADGTLIAGHQRCKAFISLGRGEEEIDVRVPNRLLTEDELKEYNVASNAIGGDWVEEILREHFTGVDLDDYGIALSALDDLAGQPDEPAEPEMPIVAKFSEKYESFVIVATNEIDANHIAELLGMEQEKCYKSDRVGRTHVLRGPEFIRRWKAAKS